VIAPDSRFAPGLNEPMKRACYLLGLAAVGICAVWFFGILRTRSSQFEYVPVSPLPEEPFDERWRPSPVLPTPSFQTEVEPILAKHCLPCHDASHARGGLNLADLCEDSWEKVVHAVRAGNMPPTGRPRPTPVELDVLEAWLNAVPATSPRATIRRLNRAEYNNTIRDLTGLDLRPADNFPADDTGHGFDNNGDVLSLPPLLLEKYLAAAEYAVEAAFRDAATRQRLLNPPSDAVPLSYRKITYPERDHVRNRLVLSKDDLPASDPIDQERQRAYSILMAFADRAYRRPATHDEVTRLLRFVEETLRNGEGIEPGIRVAFQAILCSPQFLFRIESSTSAEGRVNDFELATRLSYFLWSSCPDEELFADAVRGTLRRGNNLARQVERMLRSPKANALAENFAGQWFQTRGLKEFTPDPTWFPDFDELLRAAMIRETELFFAAIVREDRSVLDFLDGDYTFVNERLARHYGLEGVRGSEFRKVSLAGTPRRGVITHASVLAVTSNPTRTSPVKRGRWILDNILGTPRPAPPPGVEQLKETLVGTTLRQRMEQHRANPNCAACHAAMDPLGFGLESFDAIGAWRTHDGGLPVDPSGTLPDGRTFAGAAGLRSVLLERREAFARCLTEKLLTYALGRGLDRRDWHAVTDITRKLIANEYRFSALVLALVHSTPFQTRTAGGNQ